MSDRLIIVDAEHWLSEDGDLPTEGPSGFLRNARRMAQCIEYGGQLPREHAVLTLIECRRRPKNQQCRGSLTVVKNEHDELYAFCTHCNSEEFLIRNWQSSLFADGVPDPLCVAPTSSSTSVPGPTPDALPAPLQARLAAALGPSQPDIAELVALIDAAKHPTDVLQRLLAHNSAAPPREGVQELMGLIMEAWNATPRTELGGRAPAAVHAEARAPATAPPRVGRNAPCPCGSGQKYKKCCLH